MSSSEVKRGEIRTPSLDQDLDEDGELPVLTAICIIGSNLRQNVKLTQDAKSFGYNLLFSE